MQWKKKPQNLYYSNRNASSLIYNLNVRETCYGVGKLFNRKFSELTVYIHLLCWNCALYTFILSVFKRSAFSVMSKNYLIQVSNTRAKLVLGPKCIFVWGVFVPLEDFLHSYGDVAIRSTGEGLPLRSALMAIEQWGLFNVSQLLRHGLTL